MPQMIEPLHPHLHNLISVHSEYFMVMHCLWIILHSLKMVIVQFPNMLISNKKLIQLKLVEIAIRTLFNELRSCAPYEVRAREGGDPRRANPLGRSVPLCLPARVPRVPAHAPTTGARVVVRAARCL